MSSLGLSHPDLLEGAGRAAHRHPRAFVRRPGLRRRRGEQPAARSFSDGL